MQAYGLVVLRAAIGCIFVGNGAQKLFGIFGGGGLDATAAFLAQLGFVLSYPFAILLGLIEFGGGFLLIAGAFTVYASAALAVAMVVAIWKVHLAHGFFLNAPGGGIGYEYALALLAALVCLMLTGPGTLSVDERRARHAEIRAYGRARIRSGNM